MTNRYGILLATISALAVALTARAQPVVTAPPDVATCAGAPDGGRCTDNGDNCTFNDGLDRCLAGACESPLPCKKTEFRTRGTKVVMEWHRDRTKQLTGDYCIGQGFVSAEEATRLLGVPIPADEQGLVPILKERQKRVPRNGVVVIPLKPSRFGHTVLGVATSTGTRLPVLGRMTLVPGKPGGKIVSANRSLSPVTP
jgi:hypothetical protein